MILPSSSKVIITNLSSLIKPKVSFFEKSNINFSPNLSIV